MPTAQVSHPREDRRHVPRTVRRPASATPPDKPKPRKRYVASGASRSCSNRYVVMKLSGLVRTGDS
jgi:hypothetical protein